MIWTPRRIKNKTCQRVEELQLGSFLIFLGGWWQDLHSSHHKTLHSAKHKKNAKKIQNPLCGSTDYAAALRRAAHQMMGLGQILQDPHSLMKGGKPQSNLPGSDCGSVCRGGAGVSSTRRRSPWVNLRWSLQVGTWNVRSRREDDHLTLLSSELKHLNIGIAALSEVRRPDCGEIMAGDAISDVQMLELR